jgi:phosphoglycolate phosphatase-like HAD superfamily hydrolase
MLKVLIMDFDGVVIESNAVKTEAFQQVFSRFPKYADAMMAFHYKHVPLNRFAKFEHLLKLMGRAGDTMFMKDIADDFSEKVLEGMMRVPLVPGAENFLFRMTQRLPVYLASVTPAEELAIVLEKRGLVHWFRGVYGCPPWTKPLAIQDILAREGADSGDALLIGDSDGDQQAAAIAGVRFLARDSGLSFDKPAPLIFADLDEISQYLEKSMR